LKHINPLYFPFKLRGRLHLPFIKGGGEGFKKDIFYTILKERRKGNGREESW
jgi:hypothetical protein